MTKMLSFNSLSGSVPEISLPTLQSIAAQCPVAGGPAVFTARSLYAPFDSTAAYDDVTTCLENGYAYRPGKGQPEPEITNIALMPNPAKSEVTVSLPGNFEGEVRLVSATGIVVKSMQVTEKTALVVSIDNLPVGVYTCIAKAITGTTYTAKLVVLP